MVVAGVVIGVGRQATYRAACEPRRRLARFPQETPGWSATAGRIAVTLASVLAVAVLLLQRVGAVVLVVIAVVLLLKVGGVVLAVAVVLLVVGTGLQVLGVRLVPAPNMQLTRRRIAEYIHRGAVVEPGTAVERATAFPVRVRTDPPPPITDRVAFLEDAVFDLRTRMAEVAPQLLAEAQEGADEVAGRVRRDARRESEALANLIVGMRSHRASGTRPRASRSSSADSSCRSWVPSRRSPPDHDRDRLWTTTR